MTNNTCIKIDGKEGLFGHPPGRWLVKSEPLGQERRGRKSIWLYPDQGIKVSQTVEIIRSQSARRLDTCLVLYRLDNQDTDSHRVGLRFMLDTLIGGNDGVPFTLPGQQSLCDRMYEFKASDNVPDCIQALEFEDLAAPGVIAHLQLRLEGGGAPEPGNGRGVA